MRAFSIAIAGLLEELRVTDRDRGLAGESRQYRQVRLGKDPISCPVVQVQRADHPAMYLERHADDRAQHVPDHAFLVGEARVTLCVRRQNRLLSLHDFLHHRVTEFKVAGVDASLVKVLCRLDLDVPLVVEQHQAAPLRPCEVDQRIHHQAQCFLQVERGIHDADDLVERCQFGSPRCPCGQFFHH